MSTHYSILTFNFWSSVDDNDDNNNKNDDNGNIDDDNSNNNSTNNNTTTNIYTVMLSHSLKKFKYILVYQIYYNRCFHLILAHINFIHVVYYLLVFSTAWW